MKTDTVIKIGFYDVTAKDDATVSSNDKKPFVELEELKKDILPVSKYATLEPNRWLLDGTFNMFPDSPQPENMGYWTNTMSDQNGDFSNNPTLVFDFANPHTSIGLTFDTISNGDFDYDVHIKWHDGINQTLHEGDYTIKNEIYVVDQKVENYKQIQIEFLSTSKPNRWIKLDSIAFGSLIAYNGEEIVEAKLLEELNPLSFIVPVDTFNFKLYSNEKDFSIGNPQGVYSALQQSQPITVTGLIDNKAVNMGTFYLDDWSQENENVSKFKAIDAIGILDNIPFKDGKVYKNVTAEEILEDIMISADWQTYRIDDSLKPIQLSGWIPICSHREALHQLGFALGATVETSRDNYIEIFKPDETLLKTISKSEQFVNSNSKQLPFISGVEISSHNYEIEATTKEFYKSELPQGQYEITFTEPILNATATGATITKSATNYVIIEVASTQEVVIEGKGYKDNVILVSESYGTLPAGAVKNQVKVDSVTLVNSSTAKILAPKILQYYQNRREETFNYVVGDGKINDFVKVESVGSTNVTGRIEKLEIDLTRGYTGRAKVVGKNEVI